MAEYGFHPTVYGGLSDEEIFGLYRSEVWSKMDEGERRELLQETVNRAAMANGEKGACRVEFADLGPGTAGEQSGDVIRLDRERFANDREIMVRNGRVIERDLTASNLLALETVLHEDIHAWQNQCLDGTIQNIDPQLLEEYRANNFDRTIVEGADGSLNVGQQYLNSQNVSGGYYVYYFQSTERDAHLYSEMKTMQIADWMEAKYGTDRAIEAYHREVEVNGYAATLEKAQAHFHSENISEEVNTVLKNQYYGTEEPVPTPLVENTVKESMVESYNESMINIQTSEIAPPAEHTAGPTAESAGPEMGTGPDAGMETDGGIE